MKRKGFDLRNTKSSTVVEDMGDEILLSDKESILSKLELDPKKLIHFGIRVALCTVGVFVAKHFEKEHLKKLNDQKQVANEKVQELEKQKAKKQKSIEGFGTTAEQSKEFGNKLDIMEELADNRLMAIKGLDHIQSHIPTEVWLKRVQFDNQRFQIEGASTTNRKIRDFIDRLEKTGIFSSISLQNVREDTSNKNFTKRSFTMVSELKR